MNSASFNASRELGSAASGGEHLVPGRLRPRLHQGAKVTQEQRRHVARPGVQPVHQLPLSLRVPVECVPSTPGTHPPYRRATSRSSARSAAASSGEPAFQTGIRVAVGRRWCDDIRVDDPIPGRGVVRPVAAHQREPGLGEQPVQRGRSGSGGSSGKRARTRSWICSSGQLGRPGQPVDGGTTSGLRQPQRPYRVEVTRDRSPGRGWPPPASRPPPRAAPSAGRPT